MPKILLAITIDTDNAAFEDDPNEVLYLFSRVINTLDPLPATTATGNLRDPNGNTVGHFIFTPDSPAEIWDTFDQEDEEDDDAQ